VFKGAISIKKVCVDISRVLRCNKHRRYHVDMLRVCQGAISIKEVHVDISRVCQGKGGYILQSSAPRLL